MADNLNCNNQEPLGEDEVKKVVDMWVDLLKIPSITGAYIREDDNFLNIETSWSVDDSAKKDRVSFARNIAVLKSSLSGGNPVISSSGSVTVDEKLSVPSKSGQRRAVVVEKQSTGDSKVKTEFLQIWNESTLLKTYNLDELDLHKSVYSTAGLGITMTWSLNETKLAYLAEKKVRKTKCFYSTAAVTKSKSDSEKDEKKDDAPGIGEEYVLKQTWGEQLTGMYYSVIVVLDLLKDEFEVIPLPEDAFPTDISWIGESHIVGTIYPIAFWRLGRIFCTNRESRIFSTNLNGEKFQYLSEAGKACRSPRVRPDGGYIVWQERVLNGAHEKARSIYGANLTDGRLTDEAKLIHSISPQNKVPVYLDFSRNCWSKDGQTLFVVTPNEAEMVCLAVSIGSSSQMQKIDNVISLLGITKDYLMVLTSSAVASPHLRLLNIAKNYEPIVITQPICPFEFQTMKQLVSGDSSPPSIFYGPAIESVPPNSIPLIVFPHGGPHSCFVDSFSHEVALFLKLGFAVLKVNYVGSTGGTKDGVDDLLGKIGDLDVKDCQSIVNKVLNAVPCLNPDKVVAFGGSHGGFLACHLLSEYPDVYKAGVMLNPVTDLSSMVGTSDITDWVCAESGVPIPDTSLDAILPTTKSLKDAEKYLLASPIHNVSKIKGASLLLLGSEDLRVPAQQGLAYYRALKAHGKVAVVRMYADCHSLWKTPVRLDVTIHSALWFKRFLR